MKVPFGVISPEYWIWPTFSLDASLLVRCWMAASAWLPAISTSPMWLTSKRPARVRTATCSSVTPVYSTGISQPAKGTRRAPAAACTPCSGVFLSAASEASDIAGGQARRGSLCSEFRAPPNRINLLCPRPTGQETGLPAAIRRRLHSAAIWAAPSGGPTAPFSRRTRASRRHSGFRHRSASPRRRLPASRPKPPQADRSDTASAPGACGS